MTPKKKKVSNVFKIMLIGPAAVGKTSLLHRFVKNSFAEKYMLSIGVEFLSKEIKIDKKQVSLQIWDVAGGENFSFLRKTYYKRASGALLLFDLTREETFKEMDAWLSEFYEIIGEGVPFILIGNKADLLEAVPRAIDEKLSREFAESRGNIYIETSAKTGENVEGAFLKLTQIMMDKHEK